jgi:hypothetical protein
MISIMDKGTPLLFRDSKRVNASEEDDTEIYTKFKL